MIWFDAHLDLACLAVRGRDLTVPIPLGGVVGPFEPGCVTLPALAVGRVKFALGTIFIEQVDATTPPESLTTEQYREGNIEEAVRRGRAQMEVYQTWKDAGLIKIDLPGWLKSDPHVGEIRGGMGVSEVVGPSLSARAAKLASEAPLHMGILIEGADSVRSPDELEWWKKRGAVACGLAWAKNSRYAMGNSVSPDVKTGLTDLGRAMVKAMDALGVVHDLSHLSQRATEELLELTDKPAVATHSNCRSLNGGELDGKNQRHLRDETIVEIGKRGGIVGLNLFAKFLRREEPFQGPQRPTIEDAIRHIERTCELMGHKRGVGLGSDMDGGFSALAMCRGIEQPSDLVNLAAALKARKWTDEEVAGFTHLNWLGFWERR